MNRTRKIAITGLLLTCWLTTAPNAVVRGDDDILGDLEKAKRELTSETYLLRYKYEPGETILHEIEQLTTIDTTIQRHNMKTQLRTVSVRAFEVRELTAEGNMKFAHRIVRTRLWNEVTGREKKQYDSEVDQEPPPEFAHFAEQIGEAISVITLSPAGAIVDREDRIPHPDVGLGGLAIPLPENPVRVGDSWSQSIDVKVALKDKRIKVIKTRELYQLKKVETGVATISLQTQILTPINDPQVKVQLIQRISQGEIKFDLDAGRLIHKQLDFDEQVLGFDGAESRMKYLARLTERLLDSANDATGDDAAVASRASDSATK